jgi:carbonic anhydrase
VAGAAPQRRLAVVACMDARLDVARVLGLEPGDAHVIRNAGGVVTDDVIRSVAISQRALDTREVLVIQHTDCGMAKLDETAFRDELTRDAGVEPPFAIRTFSDLEQSVRDAVAALRSSPFLAHRDAVRGAIFDVETGELRDLDPVA